MRMFPLESDGFTGATMTPCWFHTCFRDNLIRWCEGVETGTKKPESASGDIAAQR